MLKRLLIVACLLLGGCSFLRADPATPSTSPSSATPSLAASDAPTLSVSPSATEPQPALASCPPILPEPSGSGPSGAFVPPDPTDVLVCRYNRASKLLTSRVLPHTPAVGLATDLNHAKPANQAIRCPAPATWTVWIFRGSTQAIVKAGWCNHVISATRTITLPHTQSLR